MARAELEDGYASLREQRRAGILALAWELGRVPLQREVSSFLNVSGSYAASLINDPDGEIERRRKAQYAGTCDKCGGPTDGSNGPGKAAKRCIRCLQKDPRPRVRSSYPIWNEQKCLDSLVRWVERNNTIPRVVDLIRAEHGERPCFGTIVRHCYRYEPATTRWRDHDTGEWRVSHWKRLIYRLPDIMVDLAPRLPASAIINASNAWVRMRLFEVIGIENLVERAGLMVCEDECGKLWRIEGTEWPQPIVLVECVNSTPDPDGSSRVYFLRVDPECETPRAGLAWTFGMEESEYELAVQT